MRHVLALLPLVLVGCTPRAEMDDRADQRFRSFNGLTMAQFMTATGVVPSGSYDAGGGRTFVAERGACHMLIETQAADTRSTADAWRIVRITRRGGGCDLI